MLVAHPRFGREAPELLGDRLRDRRDGRNGKRLPAGGKRGVALHRRVEFRPGPCLSLRRAEIGQAGCAPAAGPRTVGRRRVVVDAQVVVDPQEPRPHARIDAGAGPHVLQKLLLARTAAEPVFDARRARPASPVLHRALFRRDERVAVAERGLELQARHDADLAQVVRRRRDPRGLGAVPVQRRDARARREPDLVAAAGIGGNRRMRLPPLFRRRRVRRAQAQRHARERRAVRRRRAFRAEAPDGRCGRGKGDELASVQPHAAHSAFAFSAHLAFITFMRGVSSVALRRLAFSSPSCSSDQMTFSRKAW